MGYRATYFYAGYPWLYPLGYGVPLGIGPSSFGPSYDDESAGGPAPEQPPADYSQQPEGPEVAAATPPPFRPEYQPGAVAAPVAAQPATTLIFNDGRPPEQVHNYALTGNTLFVLDGESPQEIPLSLLNVPATIETNRAAGVDFALPVDR